MSTTLVDPAAAAPVEAPKFDLAKYKAEKRAAEDAARKGIVPESPKAEVKAEAKPEAKSEVRPEVKAEPVVEVKSEVKIEAPAEPVRTAQVEAEIVPARADPNKRPSGDERKFRRALSKRDQEIGELRAKLELLMPKEA